MKKPDVHYFDKRFNRVLSFPSLFSISEFDSRKMIVGI